MLGISVMMKPSSGMCNMKCDYCFYCDEAQKRVQESYGFMSEQTLKNIIRKTLLKVEKSASYAFQGGEPTLRGLDFFKKAMEYQKQYNKKNIQINNAIQTNGLGLDENWCKFFKENNFLVGISVDGTEEIHNTYRHKKNGDPSYERIMKSIELLEKYKVDYNILTVVNQKVARNIKEIYKHFENNNWHYQQYIACLDPLDEQRGVNEYALTPDLYGKFMVDLFLLYYEDWKKGLQPYIRQFDNYIAILAGYKPEACNQRGVCGIQTVVEADGSVYPCDFFMIDKYLLGNFNENQLEDITQRRKEIGFIERSLKLSEDCYNCKYFGICKGGCQRDREFIEETNNYKNYFCESFKYFFDNCLEKLQEMAKTIK